MVDLVIEPALVLHRESRFVDVEEISTPALNDLVANLLETAAELEQLPKGCLGLAANQIGENVQAIAIKTMNGPFKVMLNLDIRSFTPRHKPMLEECLSFPEVGRIFVDRHIGCMYRYMDVEGKTHRDHAGGWLAQVLQHENDHQFGRVIGLHV